MLFSPGFSFEKSGENVHFSHFGDSFFNISAKSCRMYRKIYVYLHQGKVTRAGTLARHYETPDFSFERPGDIFSAH